MRESSAPNFSRGQTSADAGTEKVILTRNLWIVASCFFSSGGFLRGGIRGVSDKFPAIEERSGIEVPFKLAPLSAEDFVIFTGETASWMRTTRTRKSVEFGRDPKIT
eukprot:1621939-Ditylum_brightwellii.AAC.1